MNENPNSPLTFEEQLEKVGSFGRYQKVSEDNKFEKVIMNGSDIVWLQIFSNFLKTIKTFSLFLCVLTIMMCYVQNVQTVFTLEERKFYCYEEQNVNSTYLKTSATVNKCPCDGQIEFMNEDEPSAVAKYGLVCEKEDDISWPRIAYALGLIVGSPFNGYVADKYGRKPQLVLCNLWVLIVGIASPFMPNLLWYSIFRGLTAFGVAGFIIVSYVHLAESMGTTSREYLSVFILLAWSSGGTVLATFGILMRDFVVFECVSAIIFGILGILLLFFLVESPSWRYSMGHQECYEKDMLFIAKVNGRTLKESEKYELCVNPKTQSSLELSGVRSEEEKTRLMDLFVNRYTTTTTGLIWFMWLAVSFICYSLVFYALIGNKSLNLIIGSVSEVAMDVCLLFFILKVPRKVIMFAILSVACFCAFVSMLLSLAHLAEEYFALDFIVTLAARLLSGLFWGVLGLVTAEVYPTLLRAQANGIANLFCRFSIALSAIFGFLSQAAVLTIIFGALFLMIIATVLLPETQGENLPSSVEEYGTFCKEEALQLQLRNPRRQ